MRNKLHILIGIILGILICTSFGFKKESKIIYKWGNASETFLSGTFEGIVNDKVLVKSSNSGRVFHLPFHQLDTHCQNRAVMLSARYIYKWANYSGHKFNAEFLGYDQKTGYVHLRNYPDDKEWKAKLVHLHPTSQKVVSNLNKYGHSQESREFLSEIVKYQPPPQVAPQAKPIPMNMPKNDDQRISVLEDKIIKLEKTIGWLESSLNSHIGNNSHHSHDGSISFD